MKTTAKTDDGSPISAAGNEGMESAGIVSDSEQVKVSPQIPWICQQGCGKTQATCGMTVQQCEHVLFMQNESERFSPCYRRRSGSARV